MLAAFCSFFHKCLCMMRCIIFCFELHQCVRESKQEIFFLSSQVRQVKPKNAKLINEYGCIPYLLFSFKACHRFSMYCGFCWLEFFLSEKVNLSFSVGWSYSVNGIQVYPVNLIIIRIGENSSPFRTSRECKVLTESPTTNITDFHWLVPKSRLLNAGRPASLF